MKVVILCTLFISTLISSNLSTLYKLYETQQYKRGCDYGFKYLKKNRDSEKFLTLYGLSCLETNKIDRIATPMVKLKNGKAQRENGSYFGTILLQKQLLKQALLDKKELGKLKLPKTNFVLSKIFNLFVHKRYHLKDDIYIFQDSNNRDIEYQLYIQKMATKNYMILDIYKNNKFIKRYRYN
jgi:hypothetical protein